jgi:hypothetical protein
MPLQSSGSITFANIQTEFGGTNPIGINEYYLNGTSGYVTGSGAVGIPTSGQISINQFYGKAKVVADTVPTPVVTNFVGTYVNDKQGGYTGYMIITGCSATNLSRGAVSTFNNIGALGNNGPNVSYYPSLILQARAGDNISISVNTYSRFSADTQAIRIFLNLGGGYFNIYALLYATGNNNTVSTNYNIPANTSPGNYAIQCTLEYSNTGSAERSVSLYSLHIY